MTSEYSRTCRARSLRPMCIFCSRKFIKCSCCLRVLQPKGLWFASQVVRHKRSEACRKRYYKKGTGYEDPEDGGRYSTICSLTSTLSMGGWSTSRPSRFAQGKGGGVGGTRPGTHCTGGWVGSRPCLDGCGKILPPSGFDFQIFQSVAIRCTRPCYRLPFLISEAPDWASVAFIVAQGWYNLNNLLRSVHEEISYKGSNWVDRLTSQPINWRIHQQTEQIIYIHRVIRNDCRGFNLSCTLHLR